MANKRQYQVNEFAIIANFDNQNFETSGNQFFIGKQVKILECLPNYEYVVGDGKSKCKLFYYNLTPSPNKLIYSTDK